MTAKFLVAVCPLCGEQLVWDTTLPNYSMQQASEEGLAHYKTHSVVDWATEVRELKTALAQQDELRRVPYWAMPRA